MRIALIADIHANALALDAVLARVEALAADRLVFLGDVVGYGPDPEDVTRRVMALAAGGAIVVKGNHDEAMAIGPGGMTAAAAKAAAWTRDRLGTAEKAFLAALPMLHRLDDLLFVHSDASAPAEWHYVTGRDAALASLRATEARITFCGHVHVPALYHAATGGRISDHRPAAGVSLPLAGPRRWLAVCGSAGQPRDGNPAAAFSMFDTSASELTLHRAAYDCEAVAGRIRAAGLPDSLASRLIRGA
jgi:diadenosine tetraphosphatase ApaH/serine/threonine PP2A family protein phosphatase